MNHKIIQHNKPSLGLEEQKAAIRVLKSGYISQGKEVEQFENEFCKFIGLPNGHAVAVSNGTSALFLSLWVLNAKNKEISFPTYVCASVRDSTSMSGGKEKINDIFPNTPNLDTSKIDIKNTISIIPHMYGIPKDFTHLQNTNVIEDCAQALGAKISKKFVGVHGKIGIFSFYATKLMTSGGQGGMIISKEKKLIDKVRDYREFDLKSDEKRRFNFQMTDIQAAIGREQLKKLPLFLKRREEIFQKYKKAGLDLLDIDSHDTHLEPVRYRAVMKTKNPKKIIEKLDKNGIKAIIPIQDWELLGNKKKYQNALKLAKESVSLPIYPTLTNKDIDIILESL